MNNNIRRMGYFFFFIFVVLVLYLGYLNVVVGPELSTDPHNRRLAAAEEKIIRGTIYDSNGVVLAKDQVSGGSRKRVYPLGRDTAHLLGFVSQRYGRTGLESTFDGYLLAMDDAGKIQAVVDRLLGRQRYGYDVTLTVDADLQKIATSMLNGRKGAVVALDPRTGAVLAMVSSPSFDPGTVEDVVRTENTVSNGKSVQTKVTVYDDLKTRTDNAPLLNRATRGVYPPGSTFKIITGAGALTADPANFKKVVDCGGSITVDGFVLKDNRTHGKVDFSQAMAVSCNTFFAGRGLEMGEEKLKNTARAFGFELINYNESTGLFEGSYPVTNTEIPYIPGTMPSNRMGDAEVASSSIGQGRVLASPFQMAMVVAAIANGGVMMKPVVLDRVTAGNGTVIKRMTPAVINSGVITGDVAAMVASSLERAVKQGTGSTAAIPGVRVAGKTGSAQNPHGGSHAWFVGYAPVEDPRIAVAVVVENAGTGGGEAAPVARELIRKYLGK
ncbi:MAG: peptidoglycan D,D-transpeptidase FtsI family protein [Bacillota bacterium]